MIPRGIALFPKRAELLALRSQRLRAKDDIAHSLDKAQGQNGELPARPHRCRHGADMLPLAQAGLQAGQDAFSDEAKRSLDYLEQLDPYVGREIGAFCQ